jgi:hypothetical protein
MVAPIVLVHRHASVSLVIWVRSVINALRDITDFPIVHRVIAIKRDVSTGTVTKRQVSVCVARVIQARGVINVIVDIML